MVEAGGSPDLCPQDDTEERERVWEGGGEGETERVRGWEGEGEGGGERVRERVR